MRILLKMLLIIFLYISCNDKDKKKFVPEKSEYIEIMNNKKKINNLWIKSINEGNFDAYNEVSNIYFLQNKIVELYYYSFIMANKYNCPEAYYNLYKIINSDVTIDEINFNNKDHNSINTSYYYLLKSNELGYKNAAEEVKEVFGKGKKIPSSMDFLNKLR